MEDRAVLLRDWTDPKPDLENHIVPQAVQPLEALTKATRKLGRNCFLS